MYNEIQKTSHKNPKQLVVSSKLSWEFPINFYLLVLVGRSYWSDRIEWTPCVPIKNNDVFFITMLFLSAK